MLKIELVHGNNNIDFNNEFQHIDILKIIIYFFPIFLIFFHNVKEMKVWIEEVKMIEILYSFTMDGNEKEI